MGGRGSDRGRGRGQARHVEVLFRIWAREGGQVRAGWQAGRRMRLCRGSACVRLCVCVREREREMARLWRMKCGLEKVERSCRAQLRLAVRCRAVQWSCRIVNDWQILQQAAGLAAWLAGRAAVSETELGLEIEMSGWFVQRDGARARPPRQRVCLLSAFC